MGIWGFFSSSTEAVKRNAPGLSLVKNSFTTSYNYGSIACRASYNYGSAACAKIGDMCGLQKLKQWLPGDKAQSRIGVVATNAALYTLHDSCRLGPGWLYRLAPDLLYRFVPGLLLNRSDPVMEDDAVWISICYPVEYEQSAEGGVVVSNIVSKTAKKVKRETLYKKPKSLEDRDIAPGKQFTGT
ncbi:unnamed protein product [Fraxinus pennsylvanica]|uniref:Uncharacterized protein n=1 Tax=Fraxinus pennsylvanica TaxID=56036 RepID=A0AAD2AD93_9LAMI|nr:unnamed protein product [Fraxinus pennsylvanica]